MHFSLEDYPFKLSEGLIEKLNARNIEGRIVEITGSTNTDCKSWIREQDRISKPFLLIANHQTAARGTQGRQWFPVLEQLTFSVILPPGYWDELITLKVGISTAKFLSQFAHLAVRVKWPNDIWVNGGKCGGILCETACDRLGRQSLVIGIGLNLVLGESQITTDRWKPSALYSSRQNLVTISKDDLLLGLIDALFEVLNFSNEQLVKYWQLYDAFYQVPIQLETPEGYIDGREEGINATGHLQVATSDGLKEVVSGRIMKSL